MTARPRAGARGRVTAGRGRGGLRTIVGAACALAILGTAGTAAARDGTDPRLPRPDLLATALAAYHRVEQAGLLRTPLLTLIDYTLPSSERRLWVLDPHRLRVLFHEFVAHGRGSAAPKDPDRAVRFGNEPESHRSSLGTFLTGDVYVGQHGRSLTLIGLDPGVNDRAEARRIVMHPADYVSASFRARSGGRVGRSWGCPAVDPTVGPALIERIQEGSVLFVAGAEATTAPREAVSQVDATRPRHARARQAPAAARRTTLARAPRR